MKVLCIIHPPSQIYPNSIRIDVRKEDIAFASKLSYHLNRILPDSFDVRFFFSDNLSDHEFDRCIRILGYSDTQSSFNVSELDQTLITNILGEMRDGDRM